MPPDDFFDEDWEEPSRTQDTAITRPAGDGEERPRDSAPEPRQEGVPPPRVPRPPQRRRPRQARRAAVPADAEAAEDAEDARRIGWRGNHAAAARVPPPGRARRRHPGHRPGARAAGPGLLGLVGQERQRELRERADHDRAQALRRRRQEVPRDARPAGGIARHHPQAPRRRAGGDAHGQGARGGAQADQAARAVPARPAAGASVPRHRPRVHVRAPHHRVEAEASGGCRPAAVLVHGPAARVRLRLRRLVCDRCRRRPEAGRCDRRAHVAVPAGLRSQPGSPRSASASSCRRCTPGRSRASTAPRWDRSWPRRRASPCSRARPTS